MKKKNINQNFVSVNGKLKLPKQFYHWLKKYGFTSSYRQDRRLKVGAYTQILRAKNIGLYMNYTEGSSCLDVYMFDKKNPELACGFIAHNKDSFLLGLSKFYIKSLENSNNIILNEK